ncbi:MAG: zinc ribbon domain-containing protein [Dehalococcoidia bacterium]
MDELLQWPDGVLGTTLRWIIIAAVVYMAVLWVALVAWAYRDIRQRTRDPLVQFFSVLLVLLFFLPGHWVYLILRPRFTLKEVYDRALEEEALLQELDDQSACAGCRRRVREDWLLCPSCGLQLKEPCETCQKPLSYSWVVCPQCGTEKAPRTGTGLRPPAPRPRPAPAGGGPPRRRPAAPQPQRARTQSSFPQPGHNPASAQRAPTSGDPPHPAVPRPAGPARDSQGDDGIIDATSGKPASTARTDA